LSDVYTSSLKGKTIINMETEHLALASLLLLLLLLSSVALLFFKNVIKPQHAAPQPAAHEEEEEQEQEEQVGTAYRRAGGRMGARMRQRAAAQRQQQELQQQQQRQQEAGFDTDSSDQGGESEEEDGQAEVGDRRTKKQRAREARREAREAERIAREARGQKVNLYEERRRQRDEAREAQEAAQEEAIAQEAAARAAREDEEASKWMSLISVDKEGTGEAEAGGEDPGLLGQFVDYITARKMAPLEEIATEFNLRTTDVIDRIHGLEAMGRLTGVMDERGKYIYITLDEMHAVAKHLTKKGRVTISELAAQSSSLIDLEPRTVGTEGAGKRPMLDFDALAAEDGS